MTFRDLVPADSDVWLYLDIFDHLSLEEFDWSYSNEGQHPIEPKLIMRTIFYGLTHGIVSARKLEIACRNDNRFILLSGQRRPDRRTIDRFVVRHHDRMEHFFAESVQLAQRMGLVKLGRVAIDGSRFKGNTKKKSMTYEKMERAIEHIKADLRRIREEVGAENAREPAGDDRLTKEVVAKEQRLAKIEKAKREIEDEQLKLDPTKKSKHPISRAHKSLNDSEALCLDSRNKTFMFGYNAQAVVDEESQIIVAADLHDNAADYGALPPMLVQVEATCGENPKEILADVGYKSSANLHEINTRSATAFVAPGAAEGEDADVEFAEQLTPTGKPHEYQCQAGKLLLVEHRRNDGRTGFRIPDDFCTGCAFVGTCQRNGRKSITIMSEKDRQATMELLQRSRTPAFKETYKRRKAIVEPVFGNIKNKGLSIKVTGRHKVRRWWRMACTAHNFEKIARAWW